MEDFFGLIDKASGEEARAWLKKDPKNLLLFELFLAEREARQGGKRATRDAHAFEANLMENLINLRDDLWDETYEPSRGTAHIVFKPVQREIFAAPYRDRIVHHFIIDHISDWWERRLCYDSGSCRKGKGTSFCVERLRKHINQLSEGGKKEIVVVKMDISGYFMHINRKILYKRVMWGVNRQFGDNRGKRYRILKHAIRAVVFDDPVLGVLIQGDYENWRGLPDDKSLFCQPPGRGMVIGNLTSQFFSNIYLDALDRYITMKLGYKHYGRYVDDFYIVVYRKDLEKVKQDVAAIARFLEGIGLTLNPKKTRVIYSWQGVPFLGVVVKNGAVMPGKRLTHNFKRAAYKYSAGHAEEASVVSYLGMMVHLNGWKVTDKIFKQFGWEHR